MFRLLQRCREPRQAVVRSFICRSMDVLKNFLSVRSARMSRQLSSIVRLTDERRERIDRYFWRQLEAARDIAFKPSVAQFLEDEFLMLLHNRIRMNYPDRDCADTFMRVYNMMPFEWCVNLEQIALRFDSEDELLTIHVPSCCTRPVPINYRKMEFTLCDIPYTANDLYQLYTEQERLQSDIRSIANELALVLNASPTINRVLFDYPKLRAYLPDAYCHVTAAKSSPVLARSAVLQSGLQWMEEMLASKKSENQ